MVKTGVPSAQVDGIFAFYQEEWKAQSTCKTE
jgi:hypothetical protein